MKPYALQALYRRIDSPALRLAAIRGAKALGVRHLVVRVDTNDVCNLRCPMCPLSDPDRVPAAKPMTREKFERIATQVFPRTRFLYLSCGTEPLATPNFDELLDVTGRFRVPFTSYCTNGILLRDRFIEATLRNRISEVIFSVDGASADVYEKIRVGARWSALNERLESLRSRIAAHRGPTPEIRFNFTAQRENVHELEAFARWALQWRPATLQLRMFRPLAGAQKQDDDVRTVAEFHARLPAIRALCAAHGVEVQTSDVPDAGLADNVQLELAEAEQRAMRTTAGIGATAAHAASDAPAASTAPASSSARAATAAPAGAASAAPVSGARTARSAGPAATGSGPAATGSVSPAPTTSARINCQLPWFTLYVKADGAVHPCAVHHPIGNLFESSWSEIERGAAMTDLRRSLRCEPKQICIDCQRTGASGIGT